MAAYTRDAKAVDNLFAEAGVELRHAPLQGLADPATLMALRRDMTRLPQGTVIHTHRYRDAMLTLMARRLAGRKDICVVNTRHIVRRGRDSWLYRRMYRNLDAQIFVSEAARERFLSTWRQRSLPFPRERLHVLHNSINVPLSGAFPEPEKGPVIAMFHGAAPREGTGDADRRPPQAQRGANAPADSRHRASRLHRRPQEPRPGPRSDGDDRLAQIHH